MWRRSAAGSIEGGEEMRGRHYSSRSGDFFTKNRESGLRLGICGRERAISGPGLGGSVRADS